MNILGAYLQKDKTALLLVLTVFSKELFTFIIGGVMIDLFGYTFLSFYFILNLKNLNLNPVLFKVWLFLVIGSLFSAVFLNLSIFNVLKNIIPITIIFFSISDILSRRLKNLPSIFEVYIAVSFWSAVFGIVQYILSLSGINLLIKIPGKLDSIAYEASHYAVIIIPALVYALRRFEKFRKEAIVLMIALFLTFSLTAYVVLIISLSMPYFKIKYAPILLVVLLLSVKFLPKINKEFKDRFESFEIAIGGQGYSTNLTIVSLFSNIDVAKYSIKISPFFGVGLGGHEQMYDRYFASNNTKFNALQKLDHYGINKISAHSLIIRILSETGIIGFTLFILLLRRCYIKRDQDLIHHLISLACISHFLAKSFKLGGYIDYGTPFFLSILIVNYLNWSINEIDFKKMNSKAKTLTN